MSNNNSRNNRGRNTIFTPTQNDLISNAVKSGGFNNLKATFERLSNTLAFNGLTPLQIQGRYYNLTRRTVRMFQIVGEGGTPVAGANYKNDPSYWR